MKLQKILENINQKGMDALIISTPTNILYLTGFECDPHERLLFYILKNDGSQFILCPALEVESAKKSTKNIEILGYLDTEDGINKFAKLVGNLDTVGIEKEHITVSRYEKMIYEFKIQKIIDSSQVVKDFRKYKSDEEIIFMREAARLADLCIDIAKRNLREGITELELKNIIENTIFNEGVEKMSFDTIVLFGDNASNPHGVSGQRKLKLNEYVLLDLGCYYKNYASDITRCLEFGEAKEFDKFIYNLVVKANTEAIKLVKPGVTFAELDKKARGIIEEAGYGEYFNHRLGHGLGIDCHEYPDVSQKTLDKLEKGMTFTIEPGIYIPNKVGIRIEDDILVTEDGYEVLTKYIK